MLYSTKTSNSSHNLLHRDDNSFTHLLYHFENVFTLKNQGTDRPYLMIAPAKLDVFQAAKLGWGLLFVIMFLPLLRKPELLRFVRWELIVLASLVMFLGIVQIFDVINSLMEDQRLELKNGELWITKNSLLASKCFVIPLADIEGIALTNAWFAGNRILQWEIPTVLTQAGPIIFGENLEERHARQVSAALSDLIKTQK